MATTPENPAPGEWPASWPPRPANGPTGYNTREVLQALCKLHNYEPPPAPPEEALRLFRLLVDYNAVARFFLGALFTDPNLAAPFCPTTPEAKDAAKIFDLQREMAGEFPEPTLRDALWLAACMRRHWPLLSQFFDVTFRAAAEITIDSLRKDPEALRLLIKESSTTSGPQGPKPQG